MCAPYNLTLLLVFNQIHRPFNMGFGSVPQCALHTICCMIAISVITPPCAVIGVINCLSYNWLGYETTWVRNDLGTKRLGYEMTWVRNDLGLIFWVRNDLGTKRLGYETTCFLIFRLPVTSRGASRDLQTLVSLRIICPWWPTTSQNGHFSP